MWSRIPFWHGISPQTEAKCMVEIEENGDIREAKMNALTCCTTIL